MTGNNSVTATLTFLGGASEVGRVGVLLEGNAGRLLLDYGIQPDDPPRYPSPAPDVDALLLTHAHLDHCGLAPDVAQRGTPIISTPATRDLAARIAEDTLHVAEIEGYPAPFPKTAIGELLQQHRSLVPGRSAFHGGFEFSIHNAGHIPGAAMFHFPELDFLFTGDLHTVDTGLTRAAQPVKCHTLAIESTYSGRDHPEREEVVDALLSAIDATVTRGGRVILPAFGLGRSQELLMLLAGQGYEVWLDGMGRDIARILQKHPGALRNVGGLHRALKQTHFVRHWRMREQALRGDVIVTTAGMLSGGPVMHYMQELRHDDKSALFLTGFQVPGTNGHHLLETGKMRLERDPESPAFRLECEVAQFALSGHAGHTQLLEFIRGCDPERVILYHGDNRQPLADDLDCEVILPTEGNPIQLSSSS